MSSEKYVTLKELSIKLGLDRSNLRRYVLKHGISFTKVRGSKKQLELALPIEDAEQVIELRQSQGFYRNVKEPINESNGFFYVVQLIPEFDKSRLKFGFTTDPSSRMAAFKTSSPTAKFMKTWPCRKEWEKTAIASIIRTESVHIANEVYECNPPENAIQRGEEFFRLLP